MNSKPPSLENVLAALPAVQAAIRKDVDAKRAAGEVIVGAETPEVAHRIEARRQLLGNGAPRQPRASRKSAA